MESGATADNKRFGKQLNGKKNHPCLSFAIQLLDTHIDSDVELTNQTAALFQK